MGLSRNTTDAATVMWSLIRCTLFAFAYFVSSAAFADDVVGYDYWKARTVLIEPTLDNGAEIISGAQSTGILIGDDGTILTVRHAVDANWQHYLKNKKLWPKIAFHGRIGGAGEQVRRLILIGVHPSEDAMLLRVADAEDDEEFASFVLGNASNIPAEPLDIAGYPAGSSILERASQTINLERPCLPIQQSYCELGLKLQGGYSGGPVIWQGGKISVGMVVTSTANDESKFLPIRLISSWIGDFSDPTFVVNLSDSNDSSNRISNEPADDRNLAIEARELFLEGRRLFGIALESVNHGAGPYLSQAIEKFVEAEIIYSELDGKESELLAVHHSLANASERLAYVGFKNIRFYWLDGNKIEWTETSPRSDVNAPQNAPSFQGDRFECKQIVHTDLWQDARRYYPKVYDGLTKHFAPSTSTSRDNAAQARNVAYFFVCDCLRTGNDSLDLAAEAISYTKELTSVRNLALLDRYHDSVVKQRFIETLRVTGCSDAQLSLQRVSKVP